MNAFLRKEFRESVRWLPLGLLLMCGLLWATLPRLDQLEQVGYMARNLAFLSAIGPAFVALGMSIAQFVPDQRNSARAFLVHRGLSHSQLFRGKLIIGIAMYSLAVWLPLLMFTFYLEWIGPLRLPTSARQTIPAWVASIYAFSFYFGGCMIACSNARWIGTRVLPLVFSCLITICGWLICTTIPFGWVIAILALGALGLYAMLRASQDAFENGWRRVAATIGIPSKWSRNLVFTIASIVASMTVILFPTNFTGENSIYRYVRTEIDNDGVAWYVLSEGGYPKERKRICSDPNSTEIEKITAEIQEITVESINARRHEMTLQHFSTWTSGSIYSNAVRSVIFGRYERRFETFVFDSQGYIFAYTAIPSSQNAGAPNWLLSYAVSQDRVSRYTEPRGIPFQEKPLAVSKNLLVTSEGLHWFDKDSGRVDHIAKMHVDAFAEESSQTKQRLFLYCGSKLLVYPNPNTMDSPDMVQPEATIEVGSDLVEFGSVRELWFKDQDNFTLIKPTPKTGSLVVQKRPGKELERIASVPPKEMQNSGGSPSRIANGLICLALPVTYLLVAGCILLIAMYGFGVSMPGDAAEPEWMAAGAAVFLMQVILAFVLTYSAARHRGLTKKSCMRWAIGGALGGFGVALAVIAIYPRCFWESCPQCRKSRRVESLTCEHCGSEWDLPTKEGIEIVDPVGSCQLSL